MSLLFRGTRDRDGRGESGRGETSRGGSDRGGWDVSGRGRADRAGTGYIGAGWVERRAEGGGEGWGVGTGGPTGVNTLDKDVGGGVSSVVTDSSKWNPRKKSSEESWGLESIHRAELEAELCWRKLPFTETRRSQGERSDPLVVPTSTENK